jgi:hypothetical protein
MYNLIARRNDRSRVRATLRSHRPTVKSLGASGSGDRRFESFLASQHSETNVDQKGVAEFAPGSPTGHHGGRWAVYRATWTSGDASTLVTSWSQLESLVASGDLTLVRDAAADFRCPVLGNPEPID